MNVSMSWTAVSFSFHKWMRHSRYLSLRVVTIWTFSLNRYFSLMNFWLDSLTNVLLAYFSIWMRCTSIFARSIQLIYSCLQRFIFSNDLIICCWDLWMLDFRRISSGLSFPFSTYSISNSLCSLLFTDPI
jgi:hypothetical protein